MSRTKLENTRSNVRTEVKATDKQRMFVERYKVHFNGTQAAIEAGCNKKSASVQAAKWLKMEHIQKMLSVRQNDMVVKSEIDAVEIIRRLYLLLTRDVKDMVDGEGVLLPISEMPERERICINGIKQKVTVRVDPETGEETRTIETDLKIAPIETCVDMALKHKGLYAAVKGELEHKGTVIHDFESLYHPPKDEHDPVEEQIRLVENLSEKESQDGT